MPVSQIVNRNAVAGTKYIVGEEEGVTIQNLSRYVIGCPILFTGQANK